MTVELERIAIECTEENQHRGSKGLWSPLISYPLYTGDNRTPCRGNGIKFRDKRKAKMAKSAKRAKEIESENESSQAFLPFLFLFVFFAFLLLS
ncbi:MAG: hypothetical protein MOB07_06345 [Acidobacteria bacterium]|nr:hypothetical protein [Acidobacteriota bacterium]